MVDIDGVAILKRWPWHRKMELELGIPPERLHSAFFRPLWKRIVLGEMPLRETLAEVLLEIAPEVSAETLIDYWFSRDAERNEPFLREVSDLKAAGMIVHGASNQEHLRARYLWQEVGLRHHFECLHYSAELTYCKPDGRFFDAVISKANLVPEKVCLIDDSIENVVGARKAGWQAIHWTAGMSLKAILGSGYEDGNAMNGN